MSPKSLLVCGHFSIDFSLLLSAIGWLLYHPDQLSPTFYELSGFLNTVKYWDLSTISSRNKEGRICTTLARLLPYASNRGCTDPRDRVFGMLGLREDSDGDDIISRLVRPDYDKPYAAVQRDATRFCLYEEGHLLALQHVSHCDDGDLAALGFLSWVPRFDRPDLVRQDPAWLDFKYRNPDLLSYEDDALIRGLTDPDKLALRGHKVNEIQQLSPAFTSAIVDDGSSLAEAIRSTVQMAFRFYGRDHGRQIIRTLVADRNWKHGRCSEEDLAGFEPFLEYIRSGGDISRLAELQFGEDEVLKKANDFCSALFCACRSRRVAVTASGRFLGLVPRITRESDVIVCFPSGYVPFVLRPVREEYQLVGLCYVDGLMYDEEVEWYRREAEEEIFVIQ